jgi:hypothetical protein
MLARSLVGWREPMPRSSYLPKNVDLKQMETGIDGLLIYKYESGIGKLYAIAFRGKANKPLWHYSFRSEASRNDYINSAIEKEKSLQGAKDARRQERKEYSHDMKVGDILYSSWGYDQTNIDYYEVTKVMGKAIEIREIAYKVVSEGYAEVKVAPVPGKYMGPPKRKLVNTRGAVRLNSYSWAWKWDGQPKSETKAEFGH